MLKAAGRQDGRTAGGRLGKRSNRPSGRLAVLPSLLLLLTCARVMAPPGGPLDRVAPEIVATIPDSVAILPNFDQAAVFQFNEVVSEGNSPNFGLGSGDLEKLVILSPSKSVPIIRWRRDQVTVRPREGWQPGKVYRVQLLPGVTDLSGNRNEHGAVVTLSTGADRPTWVLRGRVVSWMTRRPVPQGLVEAVLMPDSLPYRIVADSTGRFTLGPIPLGEYLVFGVIDQNKDFRWDRREEFDSLRVSAGRDSVGELWAFRHDTTGIRITTTAARDSLSIGIAFSQQLNPYQVIQPDSVRVLLLPDSVAVPVERVLTEPVFDSVYRPKPVRDTSAAGRARADSIRADSIARALVDSLRADSIARARAAAQIRIPGAEPLPTRIDTTGLGPLTSRPALYDKLVIRLRENLRPGARYVVIVRGIENLSRVSSEAKAVLAVPEPAKPPTATPKPDTTKTSIQRPRRD